MTPIRFPQANCTFGPPDDMDESQVMTIPAFKGTMKGGNLDGSHFVTVAWKPSEEEIEKLQKGEAVYLTMMGGLSPHFLTVGFPYPDSAL
jgi:hypothetical protein